jgi:hypothetical protein
MVEEKGGLCRDDGPSSSKPEEEDMGQMSLIPGDDRKVPPNGDDNSSTETGSTDTILENPDAQAPPLLEGSGAAPDDPDRKNIPQNPNLAPLVQRRLGWKRNFFLPHKDFNALNRKKEPPKDKVQLQWIQYDGKFWYGKVGKKSQKTITLNPKWVTWSFLKLNHEEWMKAKPNWCMISPGNASSIQSPQLPIYWISPSNTPPTAMPV